MISKRPAFYSAIFLAAVFIPIISIDVSSAETINIPEESLADQEQRRSQERPPEEKVPAKPESELEEVIIPKGPLGPEAAVRFPVKQIVVEGSSVFSREELKKITAAYENTELSLIELLGAEAKITDLYVKAEYITSRAFIPPQKVKDGIVIIKIFEGKIGEIKVDGNRFFKTSFITGRFKKLKGRLLKRAELRKALTSLNVNPDLKVRAVLEAGKEAETTDIILKAEDIFPHHAGYVFNNQGSRLTGYIRNIFSYSSSNFLGLGDSFSLYAPWTEYATVKSIGGSYSLPLNYGGTELGLQASMTEVKLGKEYKEAKIRSSSDSLSFFLRQPLFADDSYLVKGQIGFESLNSSMMIRGREVLLTELRMLNAGLFFDEWDKWGRTNISAAVDVGFPDFLGASSEDDAMVTPRGAGGKFSDYIFGITRLHILPYSSYLILNCQGQLTPDVLPAAKKFYTGGAYSVRGYPESDANGDYGINATAELRTPAFFIPKGIEINKKRLRDIMQFAVFTDMGATFERGDHNNRLIAGTGLGLRLAIDRFTSGRVDIAWPIGDGPTEEIDHTINFSLTLQY